MKKGFTLIEIIIVVVILGILAAIAIPKFAEMQQSAQIANVKGTVKSIRSAIAIQRGRHMLGETNPSINYWPDADQIKLGQTTAGLDDPDCLVDTTYPENPFCGDGGSNLVYTEGDPETAAETREIAATGTYGYRYDETTGTFWANTDQEDAGGLGLNEF